MPRRSRCLTAADRRPPGAGAADPAFVARLERQLEQAFAQAASRGTPPPARRVRPTRFTLPGLAELAVAAAVALAVGAGASGGGARALPAVAGTPTHAVDHTRTPHRPTGTATSGGPLAVATGVPLALAHTAGHDGLGW